MVAVIFYILFFCAFSALAATIYFALKLPRPYLVINKSFNSQPYRRFYGAVLLTFIFAALIPLTFGQFDPSGVLVDGRGSLPGQVHLTFLGYLFALLSIAAGILLVNSAWSLFVHAIRLSFSSSWADKRIGGIALGGFLRFGLAALLVIVVASGVILLFTSDPGGILRGQALDETEIYARFTTRPILFYENSDTASKVLGQLDQNTRVSILGGSHSILVNGLVAIVVNDGPLNYQRGWVAATFLSKDRSVGLLVYLGEFVIGLVHPLTLKAIVISGLISGAAIGLFFLLFRRLYIRLGGLIAILLGVVFLILRYSPFNPAIAPGAMYLVPEALVVLLFDFILAKLILLTLRPDSPAEKAG